MSTEIEQMLDAVAANDHLWQLLGGAPADLDVRVERLRIAIRATGRAARAELGLPQDPRSSPVHLAKAWSWLDPLSHAEGVSDPSYSSKVQESSLRRRGEIAGMRVVIAGTVLNRLVGILDVDRLVAAEEVHLPEASLHRLHEGT
jgi:hypothetical protein